MGHTDLNNYVYVVGLHFVIDWNMLLQQYNTPASQKPGMRSYTLLNPSTPAPSDTYDPNHQCNLSLHYQV